MGGSRIIKRLSIVLLSVGWILPMWAAGSTVLEYLEPESRIISFPAVDFSYQALTVGAIWLAVALGFWAWRLSRSA